MTKEKIQVIRGRIEIAGEVFFLIGRRYFLKESYFQNEQEQVITIKDEILEYVTRELTAYTAKALQNESKRPQSKI